MSGAASETLGSGWPGRAAVKESREHGARLALSSPGVLAQEAQARARWGENARRTQNPPDCGSDLGQEVSPEDAEEPEDPAEESVDEDPEEPWESDPVPLAWESVL